MKNIQQQMQSSTEMNYNTVMQAIVLLDAAKQFLNSLPTVIGQFVLFNYASGGGERSSGWYSMYKLEG